MTEPGPDTSATGQTTWRLFLASFLTLYFELLFIRWVPSVIHVVSFFTNLVLIACFLGMGIGVSRRTGTPFQRLAGTAMWWISALLLLVVACDLLSVSSPAPESDVAVNNLVLAGGHHDLQVNMYVVLVVLFSVVTATFIPLGGLVGAWLSELPPLTAYGVNIGGSLVGILAFAALSLSGLHPWAWVLIGFAGLLYFVRQKLLYGILAATMVLSLLGVETAEARSFSSTIVWSPYYKIQIVPLEPPYGYTMWVNTGFLLSAINLDPALPKNVQLRNYYAMPQRLAHPHRVLVLGGGAGNDVAEALMLGAEHVDVVELDPRIIELGRTLHPNHPYSDPRVRIFNQDARTFLSSPHDEKYDLVLFGTLDSHGLVSSLSSMRLENFVFTRDSLAAAARLLNDNGVLFVAMGPWQWWVPLRQYTDLDSIFPGRVELFQFVDGSNAVAARKDGPLLPSDWDAQGHPDWVRFDPARVQAVLAQYPEARIPATDDWPNLYLRRPTIPREYLLAVALLLPMTLVFLLPSFPGTRRLSTHFFFLGAGFLLLETKSVTELALVFGSTWIVNTVVFSSILVVILLANALVARGIVRTQTGPFVLLLLALFVSYVIPLHSLLSDSLAQRLVASSVFVSLPVFLAAFIFAISFRASSDVHTALASNLLGSIVGGLLEYSSMAFGFKFLYLAAIGMYALAWLGFAVPSMANIPLPGLSRLKTTSGGGAV